jgi:uncharacterized protein YjbJ (UPF0337 family)
MEGGAADRFRRSPPNIPRKEEMMNWDYVQGNWKQFRGRVKEKWGKLTDDDLDRIEGLRERLEGALQARYGKAREAVKEEVDLWMEEEATSRT